MPYARMARNLNQSIFAIIIGAIFSTLIIAIFTMDALVLAILEIPLAILVELIVVTECIYAYKDEVSIETTYNMLRSLLKSLLISIPVVLFYSAIIIILHETVNVFSVALAPLFSGTIQGLPVIVAIPLLCFIPVFIMVFATPFLLYVYGKIHILIWGSSKEQRAEIKAELEAKEEEETKEKTLEIMKVLESKSVQLQQYFLELQAFDATIDSINDHESFKTVSMRLTMMNDYVETLGIEETKENKQILKDKDVNNRIKAIDDQKVTIKDIINQKSKKLKKEKGIFQKDEESEEEYIKGKSKEKKEKPKSRPEPPEEKKDLPEPPEEKKDLPEPPEEKKDLPETQDEKEDSEESSKDEKNEEKEE